MSEVGCFSFYPSKNLGGMGDGGFMTTDDDELARELIRASGSRFRRTLLSQVGGAEFSAGRLSGSGSASQSCRTWMAGPISGKAMRIVIASSLPITACPSRSVCRLSGKTVRHIYNQFVIRVPGRRDELRKFLAVNGIGTDIYYPVPLHLQECFKYLGYREGDFPESERASRETLAMPIFPELRSDQQEYVVETIGEFFKIQ